MKTSHKYLLIVALLCLSFGSLAIIWGHRNGGLEDIKAATTAKKITQEVASFKQLDLDLSNRELVIEPSKDDTWQLSYYTDNKILGELSVQQDGEKLSLKQLNKGSIVIGPISALGYYLNNQSVQTRRVILSVPKGAHFESIKGYVSDTVHLNHFPIKDISLTSDNLYTNHTTIDKANFSVGSLYLNKTTIEQLTLDVSSDLSLSQTTLKGGDITGMDAILTADKSLLQKITISNQDGEIRFTDTELDNVTLSGENNRISATNLTLKNLIEITNAGDDIDLILNDQIAQTTHLNLTVTDANLSIADKIAASNHIDSNHDESTHTFNKEVKDSLATLKITNIDGDITLN